MQERKQGCICELDGKTGEPVYPDYPECPVHNPDAIKPYDTANELIKKFYALEPYEVMEPAQRKIAYNKSKEAATIAINEIINVIKTFGGHSYAIVLLPHYEQAKKEIRTL